MGTGAGRTRVNEARISVEEFEAIVRERVPFTQSVGARVEAIEPGYVRARAPFREDFLRPGGTIAGPVLMALADLALYGAVLSLIGPVELAVTTNLNINFLRRPTPGPIVAEATILKLGRRLAVGEVRLSCGHEREELVAHVTGTYSIPPPSE
jgi:uncharacterized protein (TIGR00369 family)